MATAGSQADRNGATAPRRGRWLGFPRGAWLIIGVEFCERFSFYGMLSILALFLTDRPASGGFGWSASDALVLVGVYSGSMYAFPAVGGYLADRVVGRRRAVAIGASCMFVGQVLLVSPTALPALLGAWRGAPLLETLHALGVPLGELAPSPVVTAAIATRGPSIDAAFGAEWLRSAYFAGAWGFYIALACLIAGNALMKSTLVVLCGETFEPGDPRRDGAYAYYYLGISVGAMLSGFVVGIVSQTLGWHYGFGTAAIGMAIALGLYIALSPRWLRDVGGAPRGLSRAASGGGSLGPVVGAGRVEAWRRAGLVFVLAMLLSVFCIGWFQMFGSWSLFIERAVNRSVGAFLVPVPWFSSVNAAFVILIAPLIATVWIRLAARDRPVDIVRKYAFALAMVAVAHLLMYGSAISAAHGAKAPIWVPMVGVIILGLGEIVAWTATYGVVYQAAPAGLASLTMGVWYLLTLGLGGYLSGYTGGWVDTLGFPSTFAIIGIAMAAATLVALLLRRPLLRLASELGVAL